MIETGLVIPMVLTRLYLHTFDLHSFHQLELYI